MQNKTDQRIVVAVTGASGSILGIRLIEELINGNTAVTGIVSQGAWKVIGHEMTGDFSAGQSLSRILAQRGKVRDLSLFRESADSETDAPEASGTTRFSAVVIMPCSMKTLSAVAHGYAGTLTARAADVALKERRGCILVPRETPLNRIHVENMGRAMDAGAQIVPPIPAFYTKGRTMEDAVDFIVGKILNLLAKPHRLFDSWEVLRQAPDKKPATD